MVNILPFKALRYRSIKLLPELICPPYDVISDEEKKVLLKKSKYNFVRIELPESPLSAKRIFNNWLRNKILIKEKSPAIYVYQQEFTLLLSTEKLKRTGLFGIVQLSETAEKFQSSLTGENKVKGDSRAGKDIYLHEKVNEINVQARFELLKALKLNTSPIFALFTDENKSVKNLIRNVLRQKPIIEFKDSEEIIHRLWIAPAKIITIKEILIADGHHRFQAARLYAKEGGINANYILMYLCSKEDPGVVVLPTHRVIKAHPDIEQKIKKIFYLSSWDGKSRPKIVCYYKGEFKVLNLKSKNKELEKFLNIPTIILDKFILNEVPSENVFYTKDTKEAVKKTEEISGFAFLVEPPELDTIFLAAKSGMVLPQKTTYFYPKVPAGLVIYSF